MNTQPQNPVERGSTRGARPGWFGCRRVLATIALSLGLTTASNAALDFPGLCESAAKAAAVKSGVPVDVLRTIALVETGRRDGKDVRPWPWTVNHAGKGHWFQTIHDAEDYALTRLDLGTHSFDVGCFQINYRWHGHAFASIEQMFDPLTNALYAADFLQQLYAEFGDWSVAAGAYHSRTPEFAARYRDKFDTLRTTMTQDVTVPSPPRTLVSDAAPLRNRPPRVNGFPLLQAAAASGRMGSLVPISGRSAAPQLIVME